MMRPHPSARAEPKAEMALSEEQRHPERMNLLKIRTEPRMQMVESETRQMLSVLHQYDEAVQSM
jgi:hypothetical protein